MKSDAPSVSLVLAKLGVTPTGAAQYSARCPAHDDATASLSIGVKKDGTIGLHCHAGCDPEAVCDAVGLTFADLFPRKAVPKRAAKRKTAARVAKPLTAAELDDAWQAAKRLGPGSFLGFVLAAIYPYRDANGKTWGWRARYEAKAGEKQIKPFHHDGSDWVLKEAPVPRKGKPLYRLPEVMASEGPVFIVEGEKCADALAAIGVSATTSGAATSAAKTDWTQLAGRTCIIWPDNDDPGDKYAADVAELLAKLDADVRLIDVAALDLPNEGDDAAGLACDQHESDRRRRTGVAHGSDGLRYSRRDASPRVGHRRKGYGLALAGLSGRRDAHPYRGQWGHRQDHHRSQPRSNHYKGRAIARWRFSATRQRDHLVG